MALRSRKYRNGASQLLGIAVPFVVSDSLPERPQTIRRPPERSLRPAGNQYWLAGFFCSRVVARRWPGCLIGVRRPRGEWFDCCHLQTPSKEKIWRSRGAAPSEERNDHGSRSSSVFCSLGYNLQRWRIDECSQLHNVRNKWANSRFGNDGSCLKCALVTTRKTSALWPEGAWRKHGPQTLRRVASQNYASFLLAILQWAGRKG
jgi:hypothetical protein